MTFSERPTGTEPHLILLLQPLLAEFQDWVVDHSAHRLRPSQYRILGNVPESGNTTVTDLAERAGMTKQGVGQLITALSDLGYLATEVDPDDRRVRLVRRTKQGNAAVGDFIAMTDALEALWAERVGTRRYRQFRTVLAELTAGHA